MLRPSGQGVELLVLEHPLAGVQLIKGTVEAGESIQEAALRELQEESGVVAATWASDLGPWESGYEGQTWHFQEVKVSGPLPDSWLHHTQDDGGHQFRLFWHPLSAAPGAQWHVVHARAAVELRSRVGVLGRRALGAEPE